MAIISMIETLSAPKYLRMSEIVSEIERFFRETENLKVYGLESEIASEASRLRRNNRTLRTPDSIQLATAIVGGADVFVTNDIKLRMLKLGKLKVRVLK